MKYLNITRELKTIESEDKKYSKHDLIKKFEDFINGSGFKFNKWIKNNSSPYECIISNNNIEYDLIIFLKNLTGAGWESKKEIKRVQVSNIRVVSPADYTPTFNNKTLLILGYYNFDENPIMVARDAYRYVMHDTIRSAYIHIDNLIRGYVNKYVVSSDSSQKVWIFTEEKFSIFLNDYILYHIK